MNDTENKVLTVRKKTVKYPATVTSEKRAWQEKKWEILEEITKHTNSAITFETIDGSSNEALMKRNEANRRFWGSRNTIKRELGNLIDEINDKIEVIYDLNVALKRKNDEISKLKEEIANLKSR